MGKRRCLLVCHTESPLAAGLRDALLPVSSLDVNQMPGRTMKETIAVVMKNQPQVVILENPTYAITGNLIARLLVMNAVERVIVVNNHENLMDIYQRERVKVAEISDFVEMVCK